MESLQETDFDIIENRRAHGKIYYSHQTKLFEVKYICQLTVVEPQSLAEEIKAEVTSMYDNYAEEKD